MSATKATVRSSAWSSRGWNAGRGRPSRPATRRAARRSVRSRGRSPRRRPAGRAPRRPRVRLGLLAFQAGPLPGERPGFCQSRQLGGRGLACGLGLGGEAGRLTDRGFVDLGQRAGLVTRGLREGLRNDPARVSGLAEALVTGQVHDPGEDVVPLAVVRSKELLRLALHQEHRRGERLVGEAQVVADPAVKPRLRVRPGTGRPGLRLPGRSHGGGRAGHRTRHPAGGRARCESGRPRGRTQRRSGSRCCPR